MNETTPPRICRYSDSELLTRFMRGWQPGKFRAQPLLVRVRDAFACGSIVAREACIQYGMDPDMMVKQRRL